MSPLFPLIIENLLRIEPFSPLYSVSREALELLESDSDWQISLNISSELTAFHFWDIYRVREEHLQDIGKLSNYRGLSETVESLSSSDCKVKLSEASSKTHTIVLITCESNDKIIGCILMELGKGDSHQN